MYLYSIMALDTEHLEEICQDIRNQYENGVANCALFMVMLVPEGSPAIDKATIAAEKYILFRDRLREMGLECGILVQCTIGHGYPLDSPFAFQAMHGLSGGAPSNIVCPYDQDFRAYLRSQFATLAACEPNPQNTASLYCARLKSFADAITFSAVTSPFFNHK